MKILLITCFLFAAIEAVNHVNGTLAIAGKIMIEPFISECICATGVNPSFVISMLTNLDFPNDACFKCFLKCLANKLNLLNPDGTLYVSAFLKIVPGASAAINVACTNQTIKILDLCEKIWTYTRCFVSATGIVKL
ncbi:hypothetical protein FQR65_LT02730 [Abscondita terminalis]|nr:hypothetical protein FQR65_LT02730 [Abscondita terminalis]